MNWQDAWKTTWKYLAAIIGIAILILMISDFNRRTAEARRLSAERDRVSAQVTSLVTTKQALETQIAYVTSDAAVYEWARQQQRMVQEGDHPVVVIPPSNSTPMPTLAPVVTPFVVENWQVWQALFFDPPTNPDTP